jgi:hypothetical protein
MIMTPSCLRQIACSVSCDAFCSWPHQDRTDQQGGAAYVIALCWVENGLQLGVCRAEARLDDAQQQHEKERKQQWQRWWEAHNNLL